MVKVEWGFAWKARRVTELRKEFVNWNYGDRKGRDISAVYIDVVDRRDDRRVLGGLDDNEITHGKA